MPRNMLIVHESQILRQIVSNYAVDEFGPIEIETAESSEAALLAAQARSFDVVVSALNMEGLDGLELFRRIKAKGASRQSPFILMTTASQLNQWGDLAAAGLRHYLVAPYTGQDFALVVNQACLSLNRRDFPRLGLPQSEAVLHLPGVEVMARVQNVSLAGVLAEFDYADGLPDLLAPVRLTLVLPENSGLTKAEDIGAALIRAEVTAWRPDHRPQSLRAAWKFIDLPDVAQEKLTRIVKKMDEATVVTEDMV